MVAPLPSALPRGLCPILPVRQPQAPKNPQRPHSSSLHLPEASSCRQAFVSTHDVDTSNSDVYLTAREFKSWGGPAFQQLPRPIKEFILDIGICHYLVVVKSPDGSVRQWDFGPCGGDVHVAIPGANTLRRAASVSLATVMHTEPLVLEDSMSLGHNLAGSQHYARGVPGEIREDLLPDLPSHAPVIHIGRTALSAQDIRDFNARQPKYYLLHENDCRHYTNNLVQHMTGMQKGTSIFLRQQYLEKVGSSPLQPPHRPLIHAMQALTDVSNWESMRCVGSLAAAAFTSLCGARVWGGLRAAPSRLAAGLASRTFSRLVKPRAGLVVTATASRPALTPVAVGAASITASKVVGGRQSSARFPWQGDDSMDLVGLDLAGTSRHTLQGQGAGEESKLARIGRVSSSVGAALAAYASAPAPQHLVHILKQQVNAVRRMRSLGAEPGPEAAQAQSLALVTVKGAGVSGDAGASAGTLTGRKPEGAAALLRSPFLQAAATSGWGGPAATPAVRDASASRSLGRSTTSSSEGAARPKLPSPSTARFFTRGTRTPGLLSSRRQGAAAAVISMSQQQPRARDAAFTAFSAALQQQAARWYL